MLTKQDPFEMQIRDANADGGGTQLRNWLKLGVRFANGSQGRLYDTICLSKNHHEIASYSGSAAVVLIISSSKWAKIKAIYWLIPRSKISTGMG